jgi:hypothetical protein
MRARIVIPVVAIFVLCNVLFFLPPRQDEQPVTVAVKDPQADQELEDVKAKLAEIQSQRRKKKMEIESKQLTKEGWLTEADRLAQLAQDDTASKQIRLAQAKDAVWYYDEYLFEARYEYKRLGADGSIEDVQPRTLRSAQIEKLGAIEKRRDAVRKLIVELEGA